MIITCKKRVPFHWIFFAVLPWLALGLNNSVMGVGFLFSLKKFVDNPAGLTFVLSLPGVISIFSAPIANFISDRIWTRFGRRKPFVTTGFTGLAVCLVLMPLMPNFWALLAVYVVYGLCNDIGGTSGPMEPLSQEIVPPQQRGRASGTVQWCGNLVNMSFYFFALGRFDDVRFMAGVPLQGEKVIYWMAALLVAIVLMFLLLGIKEIDQKSKVRGERLSVRTFFAGVLDREIWPVFMLVFAAAMLNAGLGALGSLLYTEQWGYSKQEMGTNVVVGSIINVFMIGLLAMVADRVNRMRVYQLLICAALALKAGFYLYVEYVLPDARPSLVEIIVFGECLSMVAILTNMIYGPLVYDYVTRNKMGTYMAGASVVSRVTQLLTLNGVGLFLWAYAAFCQPPAGDMVRVSLQDGNMHRSEMTAMMQEARWTVPQNEVVAPASNLEVSAWYGTGLKLDWGRCWEIRLADAESTRIEQDVERLRRESSSLVAEAEVKKEDPGVLKDSEAKLDQEEQGEESALARRSEDFRRQVEQVLGSRLLKEGDQVLGAEWRSVFFLEWPVTKAPEGEALEKIGADLRWEHPEVVGLRPVKEGNGYGIVLCVLAGPGVTEKEIASTWQAIFQAAMAKDDPGLLRPGDSAPSVKPGRTLSMKLMIIEEPLDVRISPIMRVVDGIMGWFGQAPTPEHRLEAMARNLKTDGLPYVRVDAGPGGERSLTVTGVIDSAPGQAASPDDALGERLRTLLGKGSAEDMAQARTCYDQIEAAAAGQRLTVARPFIKVAYAPMKYDYMSGYLWMIMMGLVGLAMTFSFQRREARGLIRKRGVEEATGVAVDGKSLEVPGEPVLPGPLARYIPGYRPQKLVMILIGLALVVFGFNQMWLPLKLAVRGQHTMAEVVQVVEVAQGMPDVILTTDGQIQAAQEKADRRDVFWNEFGFATTQGRSVVVRANVGSLFKSLYPLIDENGLPTRLPVWYAGNHPETAIFPTIFSTWFAPGVLVVLGLACAFIGSVLFYWAGKPIEVPEIVVSREI